MNSKQFGDRGEYLARLFLEQKGFVFLRCNYARKGGEIDLIMQENDELVFLEVKTRSLSSAAQFGRGAEKIDREKQRRIRKTARIFCAEEPILTKGLTVRFDAIEIYLDPGEEEKVYVLHTPFAFGW